MTAHRLIIVVEGGIVTEVVSERPEALEDIVVVVVDRDVEGMDDSRLGRVTAADGSVQRASITSVNVQRAEFAVEI